MDLLDNLLEPNNLNKTLKALEKLPKEYHINFQVLDYNNKVSAIFLKNGLYLPVKPSSLNVKYDYKLSDNESIKYLTYVKTKEILEYLYKKDFKTKPLFKILDLHRKK